MSFLTRVRDLSLRVGLPLRRRSQAGLRPSKTRLRLEQFEDRTVPAIAFESGFTLGSDEAGIAGHDVTRDSANNAYIAGTFYGVHDFDPTHTPADDADILTARGNGDAFIAKYGPDNSLLWARRMGGDAAVSVTDFGSGVALDGNGNVHVAGFFMGSADFGPFTLTSAGEADGFVAKLDANGDFLWARQWGGATQESGEAVSIDGAGNVYTAGYHSTAFGYVSNAFSVREFTSSGSPLWSQSWSGSGMNVVDLTVNSGGEAFLGGTFKGTVDFNPGIQTKYVTAVDYSGYVLKLSASGSFAWVSPFLAQNTDSEGGAKGIALDSNGNVLVGGQFKGSVDFDPGTGTMLLPNGASYNGYVAKLNSAGSLTWAKAVSYSSVWDVGGDAVGNVYATGNFRETQDFDPGPETFFLTSAGLSDVFGLKLTSNGNFAWAGAISGTGDDVAWGLEVSDGGDLLLTGSTRGTVDLDPDPTAVYEFTNSAYADLYFVKLTQSEPPPSVAINSVSKAEGKSGTTAFTFTVTLSAPSTSTVTVNFATANGTAVSSGSGADYQAQTGTLTFAAGQTSKTITILVTGDKTKEGNETFFVNLSNALGATIDVGQGLGTILNDE